MNLFFLQHDDSLKKAETILKVYGLSGNGQTYLFSRLVWNLLRERAVATIMAEVNAKNLPRKAITFTTNRHTGKFLNKEKVKS